MADLTSFDVILPLTDSKKCEEEAKKLAAKIKPEWNVDDIQFETFTAGITNKIFSAKVTDNDRLIFRVFGKNTEKVIDRPHELESWAVLAERGLAAKLYAKFTNGLICGYLPGKSLTTEEVKEPFIRKEICRSMANMHNIPVGENAAPCLIAKTWEFHKNLELPFPGEADQVPKRLIHLDDEFKKRFEGHFNRSLKEEIKELIELVKKSGESVGFAHNDLLIHNILFDKEKRKVSFIDYEYADVNYNLFDIANHFNEYAGVEDTDYSLCPSMEDKKQFIQDYLQFRFNHVDETNLERMCRNIPLFEAASHLFWSVWALVQAQNSLIEFDYLGYAISRHEQYKKRLEKFLSQ